MNRDFPSGEWSIPIDLAREPDLRLGKLLVRPSLCEVAVGDSTQSTEPRVMQALIALAQRKGAVVSREELVQRCWGGLSVGDDAINRCIGKVRKIAEIDQGSSFRIETVARVGYRLLAVAPENERRSSEFAGSIPPGRWPHRWMREHRVAPGVLAALALLTAASVFAVEETRVAAPAKPSASAVAVVRGGSSDLPVGAVFKDCAGSCPEMVIVPPGYFDMGSTGTEIAFSREQPGILDDSGPRHEVLIGKKYAVGRYDITRREFAQFAAETSRQDDPSCHTLARSGLFVETIGANWRHPGFEQTEHDPAVCMNWFDANAYAGWLSRKTGKPYRLLSEAEWEYAARAAILQVPDDALNSPCVAMNGADADYHLKYLGDSRFDTECHDRFAETAPVGRFPANRFGLSDMLGNVWQWTADCYNASYDGAPGDGAPWLSGNCAVRVVRGGSWSDDPRFVWTARRQYGAAVDRYSSNGFRVARSM